MLAIAQRHLCDEKRWLTRAEFLEMLSLGQLLPGPNVCNVALMVGDNFFGWRGAAAALGGMVLVPLVLVLALTALYANFSSVPVVAGALRGMGAVAAGMIVGTALRLGAGLRASPIGVPAWVFLGAATFVLIAWLRLPLVIVLFAVGIPAWRIRAPAHRPGEGRALMHSLGVAQWLELFAHFLVLSLLAIGGGIVVAPDMHRLLVTQMGLLTDAQFSASIAIAQAAPGPNVLFVAVMGYQAAGLLGAAATLGGIMLPSTILALLASRWGRAPRRVARRAGVQGRHGTDHDRAAARHRMDPERRVAQHGARRAVGRRGPARVAHEDPPAVADRCGRRRRRVRLGMSAPRAAPAARLPPARRPRLAPARHPRRAIGRFVPLLTPLPLIIARVPL